MNHALKPLRTPEERNALIALASEENHRVIHPSHLLIKDGEIVGYCGINSMPLVMSFFSKKHCKARDSMLFISQCETYMRAMGQPHYFTTCAEESPFYPHMQKLGFRSIGKTELLVKEL